MQIFKSLFRGGSFIKTLFILCYLLSLIANVLDLDVVKSILNAAFAIMAVFVAFKGNLMTKPVIVELVAILGLLLIYNVVEHTQLYTGWEGSNERGIFLETFLLFIYLVVPYYLSKTDKLNDNDIIILFLITFVYAIVMYFKNLFFLSMMSVIDVGIGETTNNIGYMFVCLLPFIYLLNDKTKQLILLLISVVFVILSAKRGAILIEFIFLLYYSYNTYLKGKISFGRILMFAALFGVVALIGYKIMLSNDYIYDKFIQTKEGYSSGRDTLAEDIIGYVLGPESSLFSLFFGSGIGTSVNVAGNWAHNDWLEFISMSGLIGVFIYLKFYFSMWRIKRHIYLDQYGLIFNSAAIMLLVMSIFSMAVLVSTKTSYSLMILMGYGYGKLTFKGKVRHLHSKKLLTC